MNCRKAKYTYLNSLGRGYHRAGVHAEQSTGWLLGDIGLFRASCSLGIVLLDELL